MSQLPEGMTAAAVQAAVRDRYSQVASTPEQGFTFPVGRQFAEAVGYPVALLESLPPDAANAFAGVACPVTQADLAAGETVVGLDFAPEMVARAQSVARAAGATTIDIRLTDGASLPIAGAIADVVIVNGIFNLNPDKDALLAEVWRVLRPGGRLVAAEIALTGPLPEGKALAWTIGSAESVALSQKGPFWHAYPPRVSHRSSSATAFATPARAQPRRLCCSSGLRNRRRTNAMASSTAATSALQAPRAIADVYDDPGIAWALRSVGTHLHPGGEDATVALATKAASYGFPSGGRVLDVASALGGPARYLARRFAVTVLGIDANPGMQERARRAHHAEGMELRCPLILARTERLPLAPGSCDAAWSQDALCHMDKPAVVAEVARVLRPGALFALTDWIARARLTPEQSAELAALWSFPSLLRLAEWVRLLDDRDFDVLVAEDRTPEVMRQRPPQPADEDAWEQEFVEQYGADELTRQKAPGELWRSLMQANLTGYGLCIARRR